MRRIFSCILVLAALFVVSLPLDRAVADETRGTITGQELLDKLSSDRQGDIDSALGTIMGVYGVHTQQGMLPDRATQKKIAELVKTALEAKTGQLHRPAHKLLEEIFDKEKEKLEAITAERE